MKTMIDLLWACLQIPSMSGAVDWDDFFDPTDDDFCAKAFRRLVSEWVQEQQALGGATPSTTED